MKAVLLKKFRKRYSWTWVNGVMVIEDKKKGDRFIMITILRFMQHALPELGHIFTGLNWQKRKQKIFNNSQINKFITENQ